MRRHFTYIFVAAAVLLSASCARELDIPEVSDVVPEVGGKATFTFTPDILQPTGTKALGETPEVKNIYFAVFDAAGYKLSEYAEAVPNSYATTNWDKKNPSSEDVYSYSVELTITDQPRIVHIIANAPESLTYGTEDEVIGSLYTTLAAPETAKKSDGTTPAGTDRKDAYWCRLYLEDGVWAEPDIATKDTDPVAYTQKYNKYMGVVNLLKTAQLVRNFTRITMTNYDNDHFQMTGFWLTNVPDLGSVAPYNRNKREFVTNYGEYDSVDELRGNATGQGNYQGFFPANASIVSIAGTEGWQESPVSSGSALGKSKTVVGTGVEAQKAGASAYCYEREVPKSDPLYIIVEGKYRANATDSWPTKPTYYKIDLKDENDAYFPILRNFNYRINISGVSRSGASTVEGALSSAPSGDISTSLDMQGLTNISDGVSQIFVSETDVVLVGNNDVNLRYKFIPDLGVKSSGNAVVVNTPTAALTDAQLAAVRAWNASTTSSDILTLWDSLTDVSQRMTLWAEIDPIVKTRVTNVLDADTANHSDWRGDGANQFPYLKKLKTGSPTEYVSQYVTISRTPGSAGAVFDGLTVAGTNAGDDYRVITLDPVDPSAVIKTETVTITGHYWKKESGVWKESTITRVVTYRLREKLNMSVKCSPVKVPNTNDEKIDVMIGLEAGLPSSIFSLDMDIEARGLSLTADNSVYGNDLPVNSGTSTISGNTKPGYWFTRTITWTEYENAPVVDGKKWFSASFKTIRALASDQVYVSNSYFNQANTTYTTYEAKLFKNLTFKNSGGTTVTEANVGAGLSFSSTLTAVPSDGKVEVAMYGIEPGTGSGLTYKEAKDGYEIYEMSSVSSTSISFSVTPYTNGKSYIRLSADSFRTEEASITVKNSTDTKFTIEEGSLEIYRVNTSNRLTTGSVVSVYFTDPSASVVKPVQTFTINNNNRNTAFELYSTTGSTIYMSVENSDGVYYAQATIDQLNSAQNSNGNRYSVVFSPAQPLLLMIDYENGASSAAGWVDLTTPDQTGKGFPVNGQAYNLLGYVTLDNLSGVQIYGKAAARTGVTKEVDGRTYYQYKTSSTTTTSTSQIINNVQLAFNGSNVAREVRVWQAGDFVLNTEEADRLTTTDDIVNAPYGVALVNVGRGRYLTISNSALSSSDSWSSTLNSTWLKFNSVSGGFTLQSQNNPTYYLQLTDWYCRHRTTASTLTLDYVSSNKSWAIYNNRYLNMGGANSYTIQGSSENDDNASRWYIYAIKKSAATDPLVTP